MRNIHRRTQNMVRKLKIMENEKQTHLGYEICLENLKNVKKGNYTLQNLDYGDKTEKRGK